MRRLVLFVVPWVVGAMLGLAGCSDDPASRADASITVDSGADGSGDLAPDDAGVAEGPPIADTSPDVGVDPCPRTPGPADGPRWVVVSHPFVGAGQKGPDFEVLSLSAAGQLAQTGTTFKLGVATDGQVHFTPDGKIGLVVLEQGKIGVFSLDASGKPTVVHAAFSGSFYAGRLLIGPKGKRAYVLDPNWRNNGGGIYRVSIGCDGSLKDEGSIVAAKLPWAAAWLDDHRLLLGARDVGSSKAGDDAHVVDLRNGKATAGADAFGDDEAIISGLTLTRDKKYGLLADNAAYSASGGNRLAVVSLHAQTFALSPVQVLPNLKDPVWIMTSPFDNAALVLGAQADSVWVLDYDAASKTPFSLRGKLVATGKTLLPGVAVMIERGSLEGRVIISENTQLRQVQFKKGGAVEEIEILSFGSGVKAIPGALGVTP
jgi:hypothetical protein